MANSKISTLTSATTPLAGTETLPIVQSGATKQVSVANLTAGRSVNASNITTTGNSYLATTSGNVGVGTTSIIGVYDKNLTVRGSGSAGIGFGDGTREWVFGNNGGNIQLYDNTASVSRFTVNSSGDFTLQSGNFIQGTAAKGINFTANTPAAGMTSQLLNWYEEGTFTPTVVGSSTAGTTSYSTQSGRYTRVGNQVTVQIVFTVTNMTGTGNLLVGGLPFTVKSGTQGVGAVMSSSMDWASGTSLTFYIPGGGTTALFYSSGDNIAWAAVPVKTAWEAVITATYFV